MTNVNIVGSDIGEITKSLSAFSDASHYFNESYVSMTLSTTFGNGSISIVRISDSISAITFNVVFSEDQSISLQNKTSHNIDFIYCLEGHVKQKFLNNSRLECISFRQNSIFGRTPKTTNFITFLSGVPVKACIIIFDNTYSMRIIDEDKNLDLRTAAVKELSNNFKQEDFRYLGRICFKPAIYAKKIIDNNNPSSSDLLFIEAAILNIMASQWERHQEDSKTNGIEAPLRPSELDKVVALESFINSNITENLSIDRLVKISGLNPAKLQLGFNYLFNATISSYVRDKRLDKAAQLIKETDYNVSELVYSIGFSSRSYFSKIFKQKFGVLPSQCVSNPSLLMAV
ncbi:helix-turn-helix domain-containing protein [Winogradskyella ouciana]|uniref:helix-turn-helix domain-containing protein n=1 Tax=Winogradskyella ouciana TaxID=2608631 RepID=UPI003D2E7B64